METLLAIFWNLLVPILCVVLVFWLYRKITSQNIKLGSFRIKKNTVQDNKKIRDDVAFSVKNYNKSIALVYLAITLLIILSFLEKIPNSSFLAFLSFLVSVLWVLLLGRRDSLKNNRDGLYLAPFQIQVLRVAASLGVGQLLAFALAMIDKFANSVPLQDEWFVWLSYILAIPFLINDEKEIKVPVNHCAVVTFLGRRLNWLFLIEGSYSWYGQKLFFGVSQSPIIQPETDKSNTYTTAGEKGGFPNLNRRTLGVWHDIKGKDPVLRFLSKTSTEVTTRLTIGIKTYDPIKWMMFNDPIAEICNRARASIRELGKNFLDVDVNPCESIIKDLLWGKKVYFIFTIRDNELFREGSVVRDNGGIPISVTVGYDNDGSVIDGETEDEAKERLMQKTKDANVTQLEAAKFADGRINVYMLSLKETIGEIAESTGSELYMIALSGTDVSEPVKKATQQLSAEANQRAAEQKTADSIKGIMTTLGDDIDPNLAAAIGANIAGVNGVKANAIASGTKGSDLGDKIIAAMDSKSQ